MDKPVYVAGFIKRMNAHAIDLSITVGAIFLAAMALTGTIQKMVVISLGYLLIFLIPVLNNGQTIGKMLFKLQPVILETEKKLTWWQLHLREAIKYLLFYFSFGIIHVASFIMASERKDRRTVHDLICKTHVIDLDPQEAYPLRDKADEEAYYSKGRRTLR